jgi:intein-encoded DNA endonuclease-like protein
MDLLVGGNATWKRKDPHFNVHEYHIEQLLRGFAPDMGLIDDKFLESVFLIYKNYFEEELGIYNGNLGSLGLFWSYKVLKLTFLHLNFF